MSKAVYIAFASENRKGKKLYAAYGGENRKGKRGYVAVNGEWRAFWLAAWVWEMWSAVGTTTWNKYNAVQSTTYTWERNGVGYKTGEWKFEYLEDITETWNYNDVYGSTTEIVLYDSLYAGLAGSNSAASTSMTIASSATKKGISYFESGSGALAYNTIGKHGTTDVKGWVRGGTTASGMEKAYFNGNDFVDIISSIVSNNDGQSWTVKGKRFAKRFIRTVEVYKEASKTYTDVQSTNRNAYPDNGVSGSYWYTYQGSDIVYSKGATSYGTVTSESTTTYPDNGRYTPDGLWYVKAGTVYSKGDTYYGKTESETENAYPENGRHSDGRWYVRRE